MARGGRCATSPFPPSWLCSLRCHDSFAAQQTSQGPGKSGKSRSHPLLPTVTLSVLDHPTLTTFSHTHTLSSKSAKVPLRSFSSHDCSLWHSQVAMVYKLFMGKKKKGAKDVGELNQDEST